MARRLILRATLRYGTYRLNDNGPSDEDRRRLEETATAIAAEMGDDALGVHLDPTDTLAWPTTSLELSYSAFDPAASDLRDLAQVWKPKLESAYGLLVHVDYRTD